MKFVRHGLNGDYVYQEVINGHPQGVRISGVYTKKDARKKAQEAFADLKQRLADGSAEITANGTLVLKS
jgi:hypothetical protein